MLCHVPFRILLPPTPPPFPLHPPLIAICNRQLKMMSIGSNRVYEGPINFKMEWKYGTICLVFRGDSLRQSGPLVCKLPDTNAYDNKQPIRISIFRVGEDDVRGISIQFVDEVPEAHRGTDPANVLLVRHHL